MIKQTRCNMLIGELEALVGGFLHSGQRQAS